MAVLGLSISFQFKRILFGLMTAILIVATWGLGCQSTNEYRGKDWVAPAGLGDGLWYEMHKQYFKSTLEEEKWYDRQVRHVYLEVANPGKDIKVVRPEGGGDATIEVFYYTGDKTFSEEFKKLTKIGGSDAEPVVRWGPWFFDYQVHPDGKQIRGAMVEKIVVTVPKMGGLSHLRVSIRSKDGRFFEYKDEYGYEDLKEMFSNPSMSDEERLDAVAKLAPEVGLTWFQFVQLMSGLQRDASRAKLLGYDYQTLEYKFFETDITSRISGCAECIHGIGAAFASKELALDIFEKYKERYRAETGKRLPPMSFDIPGMSESFVAAYTIYNDPVKNGELRLRLVDLYLDSTKGTQQQQLNIIVMFTNFFIVGSPVDRETKFEILRRFQPRLRGFSGQEESILNLVVASLFQNSPSDQELARRILKGEDQ